MAKLTIEYDKAILGEGYYMKTTVRPFPDTEPAGDLETCLVIQEATSTQDEILKRVANLTELVSIAVAPDLAFFAATDLVGVTVAVGDTLRLFTRDEWVKLGYPTYIDFKILQKPTSAVVEIDPTGLVYPVPSFYRGDFHLFTGYPGPGGAVLPYLAGTDGYTVRSATESGRTLRIAAHVDMFPSVTDGATKQTALDSEAQALITNTEIDEESFSGTDVEVYE